MIMMRASKSAALALARSSERAQLVLDLGEAVADELARGQRELEVELAQLGLEVRRGQRVEHLRVERHRTAGAVGEVELHLDAERAARRSANRPDSTSWASTARLAFTFSR